MKNIANFPFFELEFDKTAALVHPEQVTDILNGINNLNLSDLIIISHGWNNDMQEAQTLYTNMLTLLDAQLSGTNPQNKKIGVVGVFWPSKKFADKELIPGGAAAIGGGEDVSFIIKQTDALKDFFDDKNANAQLQTIQQTIKKQATTGNANQEDLYKALDQLFKPITANSKNLPDEDAAAYFEHADIGQLLIDLQFDDDGPVDNGRTEGAAEVGDLEIAESGGAAGLGSWLSGIKNGIFNILNLATYYQMKDRAGKVGMQGLNPVIHQIQAAKPALRLHLIGHSFGARLVTASIAGQTPADAVFVQSLILLQAAFSHYAFALHFDGQQNGLFRRVIENSNIKGCMAISHSVQDKAVGLAYPLASRIAKQVGAALGDENDKYGGLGRNGAQKTPGTIDTLLKLGSNYPFAPGKIYNLNADITITGHGDIANKPVAEVISAVINL